MRSVDPVESREFGEDAWIYLSLGEEGWELDARQSLRRRVIEACQESGWPAVSWSPVLNERHDAPRFLDGMSHAIEHADVVVVLTGAGSPMVDTELAFALEHERPVVGLRLQGGDEASQVEVELRRYSRGQVVDCADVGGCATALREILADPAFTETIREASSEQGPGNA